MEIVILKSLSLGMGLIETRKVLLVLVEGLITLKVIIIKA